MKLSELEDVMISAKSFQGIISEFYDLLLYSGTSAYDPLGSSQNVLHFPYMDKNVKFFDRMSHLFASRGCSPAVLIFVMNGESIKVHLHHLFWSCDMVIQVFWKGTDSLIQEVIGKHPLNCTLDK